MGMLGIPKLFKSAFSGKMRLGNRAIGNGFEFRMKPT
jgi:hypothetical protein